MIASLPMYDWQGVKSSYDALWRELSKHLLADRFDAPAKLTRQDDYHPIWTSPDLLVGQTCGYPYWTGLRDQVQILGIPNYSVEGCVGQDYSSAIIVAKNAPWQNMDEVHNARAAINGADSLSGHLALRAVVGERENIVSAQLSGAHLNSIDMVTKGTADIAAIDAVCWDMAQQFYPRLAEKLRVIAWSPLMPGLPLITARRSPQEFTDLQGSVKSFFCHTDSITLLKPLKISTFTIVDNGYYSRVGALELGAIQPVSEPLLR